MRVLRRISIIIVLCAAGAMAHDEAAASSLMVRHMSLQQMCDAAGRIFRGTVLGVREGSVDAGGGQLSTVIYTLRVDESFKGAFETVKGQRIATLQMIQGRKRPSIGPVRYMAALEGLPTFKEGHDYLVLATTPSRVGLSTTVGMKQGLFKVDGKTGQETAVNGNDNAGLNAGLGVARGPVSYTALRDSIRRFVGR